MMAESKKGREMMKCVSHHQASRLLHNKFIVVLGDSIQRGVYKDLVLLLQKEKYLTMQQLRSKGEMCFEMDRLVEGGCRDQMHNGTEYREVRQFQSDHHLVRFYFVTRIYSGYMQSILEDFRDGPKPDVVIVNSCVWDISRYNSSWISPYKDNLCTFFNKLSGILPEEVLVIWSLTMPLAESIKGGFLVPEIEHKAAHLRYDVIEANFYSGSLADAYGMDVLDLHFQFRFALQHRSNDGVHWNALANRRITSALLRHAAQAWGVHVPCPQTTVDPQDVAVKKPVMGNASKPPGETSERPLTQRRNDGYREEFFSDSLPPRFLSFEEKENNNHQLRQRYRHEAPGPYRHAHPPQLYVPAHRRRYTQERVGNGFSYGPQHYIEPYNNHHHHHHHHDWSRQSRHHYAPYPHHRPPQWTPHGGYY